MEREQAYREIDRERDYQDKKWGGAKNDTHHGIGDWIVFMEIFLNRAKEARRINEPAAVEQIKKVVALGVACMEYKS